MFFLTDIVETRKRCRKKTMMGVEVIALDYQAMGRRIRQRRRWLDMTQERLAEAAGLSTSFVGHIERGSRIPSVETLWEICKALEISMDDIVAGE